jgi:hypothetical protein
METNNEMNEIKLDMDVVSTDIQVLYYTNETPTKETGDDTLEEVIIRSNSPVTMSEFDSDSNSDSENDVQEIRNIRRDRIRNQLDNFGEIVFKEKKFTDIEKTLTKYHNQDSRYSKKLDILITFMKGQKSVFLYSKFITQQKNHLCMLPVLLFSAAMAIFAPIIQEYSWSGGLISGMNVVVTFLVSMMNYMKYESAIEKYQQLSSQYDKLETSLEMTTNKLLFIEDEVERNTLILNKLKETEIHIHDFKDSYNILMPEEVIRLFPIISNLNVFSLIKKMEMSKKVLVLRFKDIKNEIRYILFKWKRGISNEFEQQKEKARLLFLYEIKDKTKGEILECERIYEYVDELFTKEIHNAEHNKYWYNRFFNKRTEIKKEDIHPVLQKYFQFIFEA